MYVRCFTKTDGWNEWLSVKERLALEIKKIKRAIKLVHFQVSQFISRKNDCHLLFSFTDTKTLFLCCNSECYN